MTFEEQIQSYMTETYQNSELLSKAEITQLSWLSDSTYQTNEKNIAYTELMKKSPPQDRGLQEVKRALSRIYCLSLLRQGTAEAYQAFIIAQQESHLPDILAQSSFEALAKDIKKLDQDAYQALRVATLLSSVTLSAPAQEKAIPRLQAKNIPLSRDSVEFMAETIEHCPDIYPLTQTLSEKGHSFLKMAFPSRTHFRHMMYTEGGLGMFEVLKNKVKAHQIDQNSLDFWADYWMINITGFRGHLNPKGSVYLSENTFKAIQTLKSLLNAFIQNPELNILKQYLSERGRWLGLDKVQNEEKGLVLAHIAAMLRLYTPESGPALLKGFESIPAFMQDKILSQYANALTQNHEPTPTYGPALFANALDALSGDVAKTVRIFLPVYASTLERYRALREEATSSSASSSSSSAPKIDLNVPLNFNSLAAAPMVKMIIETPMDNLNSLPISIDPKTGEAKLNVDALEQMKNPKGPLILSSSQSTSIASVGSSVDSPEESKKIKPSSN